MSSRNGLGIPWMLLTLGLMTSGCSLASTTSTGKTVGWELIWQDEFDGPQIDWTKWEHEVDCLGGGNDELQCYTDRAENSFIEEEVLIIQALEEPYRGRKFTSARLRTLNLGDWAYGRFDIRAKLPVGQGIWPAIWMLPTNNTYGGWAASGEIDIVELLGQDPNVVYGTLHYGGSWPSNVHSGDSFELAEGDFSQEFHVFSIQWGPGEIRWYVDGEHYQTQTHWYSENGEFPAPFDQQFHLILNVAVGGNWPGPPDETTSFPQQMLVDYVRVYHKAEAE